MSFTFVDPPEENSYLLVFEFYNTVTNEYMPLRTFRSNDQSLNENLARRLDNGEYLFNDNLFNSKKKSILLQIPSGNYINSPDFLLKLYSLTKDAYLYSFSKSNSSGSVNSSAIYSNVKNGLGIFAARSLDVDTIK